MSQRRSLRSNYVPREDMMSEFFLRVMSVNIDEKINVFTAHLRKLKPSLHHQSEVLAKRENL